jgi:hypothetical protein
VIRIERVPLPDGLRAIAHRDPRGDLIVYVSDALDAECVRATVRKVIRASRRAGWRAGVPPVGVAVLAALGQWLRGAARVLGARSATWATAATAATALVVGGSTAAVFLTRAPHQHISSAPAPSPVHSTALPGQPRGAAGRHRGQVQPAAATPSASGRVPADRPKPGRRSPAPGHSSPAPSTSRSPAPAPSPAPRPAASPSPSPAPSPSPSPSGGSPGGCVTILGIHVCV